jgi:hypothetical protein
MKYEKVEIYECLGGLIPIQKELNEIFTKRLDNGGYIKIAEIPDDSSTTKEILFEITVEEKYFEKTRDTLRKWNDIRLYSAHDDDTIIKLMLLNRYPIAYDNIDLIEAITFNEKENKIRFEAISEFNKK